MALNGLRLVLTCWATVAVVGNPACSASAAAEGPVEQPRLLVTSVGQFRNVFGADYVLECDFRLSGVITLVDTNRSLAVLQDADGPVALHFAQNAPALQVGQSVRLHGTRCTPYFARFPDYPYRPTGREVMPSFQAPADWGNYYLTRMRGILRPPVTGYYSFWIASDNSSELWLSTDASPSRIRKLAFMGRFAWSNPGEWTRFPSQHAEPVFLQAGESYYIEALHEQSHGGSHLAVAWEGPSISRSVIPGTYLTPWQEPGWPAGPTNGILREYWTNYCAADLAGIVRAAVIDQHDLEPAFGRQLREFGDQRADGGRAIVDGHDDGKADRVRRPGRKGGHEVRLRHQGRVATRRIDPPAG